MEYVDREYYDSVFKGEPIAKDEFPSLLGRASELVEEMCMYRILPEKMETYGTFIQERVKKAICAQIEYLDANGGSDLDTGASLQSASLGKFSYSGTSDGNAAQSLYAPRAMRILAPTGLLYRGGD
ncbi:protein gp8 [Firmicutes bacterium CAG:646]|nr:protein gp8 [Firmicutes bacterium CAG:646]